MTKEKDKLPAVRSQFPLDDRKDAQIRKIQIREISQYENSKGIYDDDGDEVSR